VPDRIGPPDDAPPDRERAALRAVGAAAVYGGALISVLALVDLAHGLPFGMPRAWHVNRPLWVGIGVLLVLAGGRLQRREALILRAWQPRNESTRFGRLVVYTREGCHLCDDAKSILAAYSEYLPPIEDVDIDNDADLRARFGDHVPVVEIDGKVRFRGRINEVLLRRLMEGHDPGPS
jgi:glutaredoxin